MREPKLIEQMAVTFATEIERLRAELFRIQCRVLDFGTDTALSGPELRRRLMRLRQEMIEFDERVIPGGTPDVTQPIQDSRDDQCR